MIQKINCSWKDLGWKAIILEGHHLYHHHQPLVRCPIQAINQYSLRHITTISINILIKAPFKSFHTVEIKSSTSSLQIMSYSTYVSKACIADITSIDIACTRLWAAETQGVVCSSLYQLQTKQKPTFRRAASELNRTELTYTVIVWWFLSLFYRYDIDRPKLLQSLLKLTT